jgi:ABC-type antimicrobial peptide transport system permease subunit
VGVVGGIRDAGLGTEAQTMLYLPSSVYPVPTMALVARTPGDPLALAPALRRAVWAIDPDLPVYDVFPLRHVVSESVTSPRTRALLLALFAFLALVLAAVGVYGVVAYAVDRRTREIGLRIAIGARPIDVLGMVVRQGMAPVAVGGAVGLLLSLSLGRLIASQLHGVHPADPLTYLAVPPVLAATALLACFVPARRATRVEPMSALRAE